jgi:hypothetical protein
MIICDLSGEAKDCLQKEIEGKEYDICSECWSPLARRLVGKGRTKSGYSALATAGGFQRTRR